MEKRAKRKGILVGIKEYLIITLGLLIYSLAWVVLLIPNKMVGGGVTGFSAILYYATGFPISYTYFILNALLLALALKILGRGFGMKTVYAIFITSIFLQFLPSMIPADLIKDIALDNGKLLCAIIGGAFAGLGIGMTFTQGGSSGGTDIIALMRNKYRNISPGKIILYVDVIIIGSSLLLPETDGRFKNSNRNLRVYAFSVTGYTIDLVLSGTKTIVTSIYFLKKHEEIAQRVSENGSRSNSDRRKRLVHEAGR